MHTVGTTNERLEIWGRAQCEAAWHHNSDEELIQGGEIYLVAKSRNPKSNAVRSILVH